MYRTTAASVRPDFVEIFPDNRHHFLHSQIHNSLFNINYVVYAVSKVPLNKSEPCLPFEIFNTVNLTTLYILSYNKMQINITNIVTVLVLQHVSALQHTDTTQQQHRHPAQTMDLYIECR
jgi:hypothetical protein